MKTNFRNLILSLALCVPFSAAVASMPAITDVAPGTETLSVSASFVGVDSIETLNASSTARSASSLRPSAAMGKGDFKYSGPLVIKVGARIDYQRDYQQSEVINENTGFKGNNVMVSIQGNITERFSYRFRQRINATRENGSFFDGTDYMWLQYNFNDQWDIRGGRVAIEYGATEYQYDPSQSYILSDFYNYPPCYLFGLNLGYNVTPNDRLVAQAAESSFRNKANSNLLSYALSWYGNHDWFHTMYSFNANAYSKGNYIYYISLGNQFDLNRQVLLNVDLQNRFTGHGSFWKDCTVRGELIYMPNDYFKVIGVGVYSVNRSHDLSPNYLAYGTDLTRVGALVEFMPIPKIDKLLKIHAGYNYCWGQANALPETTYQHRHFMSIGLQWEVDVVSLAKKILKL